MSPKLGNFSEQVWGISGKRQQGCDLLAAGASLLEIAEVLRHSDVAVTAGYARVDAVALAMLVRPWPGSGQLEGGPE